MCSFEDLINKLEAAYWYCAAYHEGQSSVLYRFLCENPFKPCLLASGGIDDCSESVRLLFSELEGSEDAESLIKGWIEPEFYFIQKEMNIERKNFPNITLNTKREGGSNDY